MSKILVINSSVSQKENSDSFAMSNLFINEYKTLNSNDEVVYVDLNDLKMAEKTLTKNNIGTYFNEQNSFSVIEQLKTVDKIVINFFNN